jgi:small-conductance mechanosensitive channel
MDTSFLPDLHALTRAAITALPLAVLVLIGAGVVQVLITRGLNILADRTHLERNDLLPVRKVLKAVLYLVTAILILTVFGVNLGGLWAILSTVLAMIAIGFVAVWSLLSNVSSTVIILLFRPFAVGDELEFAGEPVKGKVVDLNFLYTTLQTEDGALFQIPNNLFFQKSLKRRRSLAPGNLAHQLNRREATVPAPAPASVRA